MVLGSNRKAEMGVGTLIIFIAMLLVAAVAAGVLLQTASSLQQRALATGQASKAEISTNARIIEVSAIDGSDQTIENFTMQMKLSPGSDPIKLSEVTLSFSTDSSAITLLYLADNDTTNSSNYCGTNTTPAGCAQATSMDSGTFTVEYIINGSNHVDGNLQRGDIVNIHFDPFFILFEDEHARINFIPKTGTPTLVEFNTPDVISTERVYLYP